MEHQFTEEKLRALEILGEMTGESGGPARETAVSFQIESLRCRLREDVTEKELDRYREQICYAAALGALESLSLAEEAGLPAEFRAGELTLKSRQDAGGLGRLLESCMASLAPVLRDDGFYFRQIPPEEEKEEMP